jgi:G3E family GTPase
MPRRTPLTVITGPLGSGKTTLLRHIVATVPQKLAILMNEFGEIAIDSRVIEGKNVRMAELAGGCVCCSLVGEFAAAVDEILETVQPERIVVEAIGLAEPEGLLFNIQEDVPQVRLDGVVTVVDADALVRFPQVGHTTRLQIEAADLLVLNKADLVPPWQLEPAKAKLTTLNTAALIVVTWYGQVDPDLLFGLGRGGLIPPPQHVHQPELQSFGYRSDTMLDRDAVHRFAETLAEHGVYRAKGFVRSPEGGYLFNYVAGRWNLEPFATAATELVFIGKDMPRRKDAILADLAGCAEEGGTLNCAPSADAGAEE